MTEWTADALALERRRVDDILRASITAIPHPGTVPVTPREA